MNKYRYIYNGRREVIPELAVPHRPEVRLGMLFPPPSYVLVNKINLIIALPVIID